MESTQILIVEDDRIIVMELEDRLEILGYTIAGSTSSGEEAIALVEQERPDLILMDIRLRGDVDGVQAAAEIRARFDVPVVYLTAYTDQNTLQRAKITEPYGYIVKPFAERELHSTIEMALHKHTMERKLRKQEQWLAATLHSIGDAVITTDAKGMVTLANPVAEALTGWQAGEAIGQPVAAIFQTIDQETRIAPEDPIARTLQQGQGQTLDGYALLSKEGNEIPIDGSTALIKNDRGGIDGTVLVFRDITERQQETAQREELQARLFQAQQREAVGALASDIVHDFNNLMTSIIGYGSLLSQHLDNPDLLRRGLGCVRRAGHRATVLTQQLLDESQRQMPGPRVMDLHALLMELERTIQPLVAKDISLAVALEPGRGLVLADPLQMEQAVLNLVVNAHEALPEGGEIRITTEHLRLDADNPSGMPGNFVRLVVADTGTGIAEDIIPRIFEAHFTTKSKGSGLGLSIARDIIRRYDGWIDLRSSLGQGTTVKVYLPAAPPSLLEADGDPESGPGLQGGGEQILLVENDWSVCTTVSDMLRTSGYAVSVAASTKEAFALVEREKGKFDLLITDAILPDRDGLQFATELLAIDPGLEVLLTSGYVDDRTQWSVIYEKGYRFLPKPFELQDLLSAVQEALGRASFKA